MHVPSHGNCYILRRVQVVEVGNLVEIPSEIVGADLGGGGGSGGCNPPKWSESQYKMQHY